MAELTPEESAEHETFISQCMQGKLATMPDMGERRKACQDEWDAAHPVAPLLAGVRPQGPGPVPPRL